MLPGMTANHLASLALETWRASGSRTPERLTALVIQYAQSYYGPELHWAEAIKAEVDSARAIAGRAVRSWELVT